MIVVDLHDTRVHQPTDRLGFLAEAAQQIFSARRAARAIFVDTLDRHFARDRRIPPLVDDAHTRQSPSSPWISYLPIFFGGVFIGRTKPLIELLLAV